MKSQVLTDEALSAIYGRDERMLARVVAEKLDVNARDEDGRTLLMHACLAEEPSTEIIQYLIRAGADVNAQDGGQRWSALHFASRDQKKEIVEVLLKHGATVDLVDDFGNTPLWRAVMEPNHSEEVVKRLLESGADPGKKNRHGVSAMDIAQKTCDAALVKVLERRAK